MTDSNELARWVARLSHAELPVMKQTARALNAMREDEDKLSAIAISDVIARDPIMTVKLLRYLQLHKRSKQTSEVVQIEQALLMLGVNPFFNNIPLQPIAEEMLKHQIAAIPPMLRVVHRLHRASEYAKEWAVQLHDLHYEEVRIAALLHDLAEVLMWCFAPEKMTQIRSMQQKDRTLRSRDAQIEVLGFPLPELQRALATEWALPSLLLSLMNDACANQPRVRNVVLAVDLARHSANGWDDAALPDDYAAVADLLRIKPQEVMVMVGAEAGILCDLNKPH